MRNMIAVIIFSVPTGLVATPSWVSNPPHEDAEYKYYIGRSADASNEAAGVADARRDGVSQAIRENFGFTGQISQEVFDSMDKTTATLRFAESSSSVQLKDFEELDLY